MMNLDVLVPVYNVTPYLRDFLKSLEAGFLNLSDQKKAELSRYIRVVFVEDCSTDDSLAILQDWQKSSVLPCKIVQNNHNKGLTKNRQILLDHANADYIWYLDSDDLLDFSLIDLLGVLDLLNQYSPDVLLFDYRVFVDKTGQVKNNERLAMTNLGEGYGNLAKIKDKNLGKTVGEILYHLAILDDKHYFWNKIFRRDRVLGLVDFAIPAFEDLAYTPIWLYHCQSYFYLPMELVAYRIRENSISQKLNDRQFFLIQAYLDQADFCRSVVGDRQCEVYLLYKAYSIYFRLKKLCKKRQSQGVEAWLGKDDSGMVMVSSPAPNKPPRLTTKRILDQEDRLSNYRRSLRDRVAIEALVGDLFEVGMVSRALKLRYLAWLYG